MRFSAKAIWLAVGLLAISFNLRPRSSPFRLYSEQFSRRLGSRVPVSDSSRHSRFSALACSRLSLLDWYSALGLAASSLVVF